MRGKLDPRPALDDRVNFALGATEKRKAYEIAAREGLPLSAYLRRIVVQAVASANDTAGGNRSRAA